MALAWKPEHSLKAIYIGIAWPFIVSALAHIVGPLSLPRTVLPLKLKDPLPGSATGQGNSPKLW